MKLEEIKGLDPKRVIVLDTETTGLSAGNDEILSLTIIDLEGTVLFDELINPDHRQRWPKAQEIHGITPAMVKGKKRLAEYGDQLRELWRNIDLVVGYNVGFDTKFLYSSDLGLAPRVEEFDVMREFAPIWGEWDAYHNDYRWAKLTDCAGHYGVGEFDAHSSLGDTEATRRCFLALTGDPAYIALRKANEERAEEEARQAERAARIARRKADKLGKALTFAVCFNVLGLLVVLFTDSPDKLRNVAFYLAFLVLFGALKYLRTKKMEGKATPSGKPGQ